MQEITEGNSLLFKDWDSTPNLVLYDFVVLTTVLWKFLTTSNNNFKLLAIQISEPRPVGYLSAETSHLCIMESAKKRK